MCVCTLIRRCAFGEIKNKSIMPSNLEYSSPLFTQDEILRALEGQKESDVEKKTLKKSDENLIAVCIRINREGARCQSKHTQALSSIFEKKKFSSSIAVLSPLFVLPLLYYSSLGKKSFFDETRPIALMMSAIKS